MNNILDKGFRNVSQGGQTTGFQLQVRTGYYRGTYLSLLEGFEVTVDKETFKEDQIRVTIGNRTYSTAELANQTDARWPFLEPATLLVAKPGGLKPGRHDVKVVQKTRVSYMPVQPSVYTFTKRMTLVQ
jgi:hypothetical protein